MATTISGESATAPLTFDELACLLAPLGTLNSPSELHGLLCGKFAGGATLSEVHWLLEAVEFLDFITAPDEQVRLALTRLYQDTQDQLQGDLNLRLMLPDDDSLLSERARALSEWSHGFLTGFGSVDHQGKRHISAESQEMLQDLAAIVQIQVEDEEGESGVELNSAEADYMEVTEYLRQVVSALYLEFALAKLAPRASSIKVLGSDQLH